MKTFKIFLSEKVSKLFKGDNAKFAIDVAELIDNKISSIDARIEIDKRPSRKENSKTVYVSQFMPASKRGMYTQQALGIIKSTPGLEAVKVKAARASKDFAFKTEGSKIIYVNNRPDGKRGSQGDDPNELMAAALCLLPSIKLPKDSKNTDEIDKIIDQVIKLSTSAKVSGATAGQQASVKGDYINFASAFSAAIACHKAGYGGADKVYLTGQAWDDDVKQFQRTRHGMKDFNSSDFIVKKGNKFLGVSLKKKKRETEGDPTLINKAFISLLNGPEFDKVRAELEDKTGQFYVNVIKTVKKDYSSGALNDQYKAAIDNAGIMDMDDPTVDTWKKYIQAIPNDLVNAELKGSGSLMKDIADIVTKNSDLMANKLVQLIFKAELKDLQKVNFDFALVTGVGDYGIRKGFSVGKADYKDIDTMTTVLDELFSSGKPKMELDGNAKQAFEPGATAANLKFIMSIGATPIINIILRYKGNFRSAPTFTAEMTPEFKELFKK